MQGVSKRFSSFYLTTYKCLEKGGVSNSRCLENVFKTMACKTLREMQQGDTAIHNQRGRA